MQIYWYAFYLIIFYTNFVIISECPCIFKVSVNRISDTQSLLEVNKHHSAIHKIEGLGRPICHEKRMALTMLFHKYFECFNNFFVHFRELNSKPPRQVFNELRKLNFATMFGNGNISEAPTLGNIKINKIY